MKTYEHNTNKPLLYTEKSEEPIQSLFSLLFSRMLDFLQFFEGVM